MDEEVEGEEEEEGKNNVGNEYVDRDGCCCVWVSLIIRFAASVPATQSLLCVPRDWQLQPR